MIDSHCHLADNKFKNDVEQVIEDAKNAGIQKMVTVAEFPSQFDRVLELCQKFEGAVFGGIGVHPIQKRNKSVQHKHLVEVESYLSRYHQKYVVCVGEIGLDHTFSQFKLTETDLKIQEEIFRAQISMAKMFGLPMNVHSRSAAGKTIEVLRSESAENVLLHAFDGEIEEAKRAVELGYYFSVPPSFAREGNGTDSFLHHVPTNQLLLETDAPALGVEKGARNEPKNLRISAEFLSKLKGISVERVIEITTSNAMGLFWKN